MSKILTVNGVAFPLDTKKTLLENLESQAINIEFHCRDGYCGACRCTLVSGEVHYINQPIAYMRPDDILVCCSQAFDHIEITTK